MSLPAVFSARARIDLAELEEYLSVRFSTRNAERYTREITAAAQRIGLAPFVGLVRQEIGPNVRCIGFKKRVSILFVVEADRVVIIGLDYGGRLPRPFRAG